MIINAMTLGQLQIMNHFLRELEADGIPGLNPARTILAREEHRRRMRRRHKPVTNQSAKSPVCPHCGAETEVVVADDVYVRACRSCRWSDIVGGVV